MLEEAGWDVVMAPPVPDAPECANHPDFQRMLEAESVCGGYYGWMEVTAERYRELCGSSPPTERAPAPAEGSAPY